LGKERILVTQYPLNKRKGILRRRGSNPRNKKCEKTWKFLHKLKGVKKFKNP